jgi:uncharacterized protein (TIGR00725 family)
MVHRRRAGGIRSRHWHDQRMTGQRPLHVAVVGPGDGATQAEEVLAKDVGRALAGAGAVLLCGGLGGVMAAACAGAAELGGTTVGLLPGPDRAAGNPHLTVALATGLGELRNGLLVRCADVVLAVGGSWGTLSEVALARRTGVPVVAVGGWQVRAPGQEPQPVGVEAGSAAEAVARAMQLAADGSRAEP